MKSNTPMPPRLLLQFFRWYCHPKLVDHIEGDLLEVYLQRKAKYGKKRADLLFSIDVILLFRPGIIRPVEGTQQLNSYGMYRSYFKVGWRALLRDKVYSSINITGLAVGMSAALMLGVWTWDELSFNSHFQHHERLVQIMLNQTEKGITYTGSTIAPPIADPLKTQFSDEIRQLSLVSFPGTHILSTEDVKVIGKGQWVEPSFPDMFTLEMMQGSRQVLKDPSTVMLSVSLARALFGNADPMNKLIRVDNDLDMTVGGVFRDFPTNTTFRDVQLLLPWGNKSNRLSEVTDWDNHSCLLFAQLYDHADMAQLNEKIKGIPTPYFTEWKEEIMAYPFTNIHLYDEFVQGRSSGGRIEMVTLVSILGVFVLVLACINFMNLSTAKSEKRAKEVGVRKAIGSRRGNIVIQFLSESLLISFISFLMSLLLSQLSLPLFITLVDKPLTIPWSSPVFWLITISFSILTGILSGSYPAFYLSAFKPTDVLKGNLRTRGSGLNPRRVLVVFQFTVSLALIISALVFYKQIQFGKNRLAGFSRGGLLTVYLSRGLHDRYDVVKNELLQTGYVDVVARSSQSPAHFSNNNSVDWRGKDPGSAVFFRNVDVSPEFGKALGWVVKEGRDFSVDFADSSSAILNEAALNIMGLENSLGEIIKFRDKEYRIVGIVNDMVTQSPYEPSEPSVFFTDGWQGVALVKLNPSKGVHEALENIRTVFKKHNPSAPFSYSFVDEDFARKFSKEEKMARLATCIALFAGFISCLGLFGLSSFVAEQRTKEIGIRKVLGASATSLWRLLSRDFALLVGLSSVIASPLAYYFLNNWLQNYPYRTNLSWWIFVIAIGGTLLVTLLTVSVQTIKACTMGPVKSLRLE